MPATAASSPSRPCRCPSSFAITASAARVKTIRRYSASAVAASVLASAPRPPAALTPVLLAAGVLMTRSLDGRMRPSTASGRTSSSAAHRISASTPLAGDSTSTFILSVMTSTRMSP